MKQPLDDDGQWLERFRPYLKLLARVHVHPGHAAKIESSDIVQQTLLNAFARRDQFRGTTEAERAAWLREILKHCLADALRDQKRGKRDVRREQSLEEGIVASMSRAQEWLVSVQSSPSQRAVRQEDLLRLSEAVNKLPDVQREAIILHHLQGLKLAEVAAEIGRSEAAVAGLLFRGLRNLQTLLCQ